nr:extracellular solute-binding protein [uncultured Desulfobacter sp.]
MNYLRKSMKLLSQAVAVTIIGLSCITSAHAAGELKLFNWSDYMPQELLDKFSKKYDVKVLQDTYDSNETLLAKLKSGATGYDVAVPGDYMVAILVKEGLLEKVEPNQLSNFKNMKKEINDLLIKARKNWLSITSDGSREMLVSGDAAVSMLWNGMALRARMEKPSLKYAYPKEGMTAWADNLVVLKGAENIENAKLFMNFLLEPENAAALTNFAGYTEGVEGTGPYLDEKFKNARELNPPAGAAQPEFVPPCDADVIRLYDRIWTNLLK